MYTTRDLLLNSKQSADYLHALIFLLPLRIQFACLTSIKLIDRYLLYLSNERVCQVKNSTMAFFNCQKMFLIELITADA